MAAPRNRPDAAHNRLCSRSIPMQPRTFLALLILGPAVYCAGQGAVAKAVVAPPSSQTVKRFTLPATGEPALSMEAKLKLLRQKVKYVFVLFQENRSFDFYFSTYPG